MKPNLRIYTLILFSMIFWGISFVWTRIALAELQPIALVFIRLVSSSAILIVGLKLTKKLEIIRKDDYKHFILASFFNPFLYFLGETFGIKYTSPVISAVIISTIPVFTPVAAFLFLKEKLTFLNIIGLFISFFGVLVMLGMSNGTNGNSIWGILFLLFAVFAAIAYSINLKKLSTKYGPFSIVAWQNLLGSIMFLPFFLIFNLQSTIAAPFSTKVLGSLILLVVFASSLAFIFYTKVNSVLGVSRTAVFTNFIPVFTAIFSWMILDEELSLQKIFGMALVIGGVFLTQIKRFSKEREI